MNKIKEMKLLLKEFKLDEFYIVLDLYLKAINKEDINIY